MNSTLYLFVFVILFRYHNMVISIRGRVPGAGHSFFVFGRNQYHRKLRTHVDSTFGRIQYHSKVRSTK